MSAANSTATPLLGNATFTGTFEDVSSYAALVVSVFADHSAAAGFPATLLMLSSGSARGICSDYCRLPRLITRLRGSLEIPDVFGFGFCFRRTLNAPR